MHGLFSYTTLDFLHHDAPPQHARAKATTRLCRKKHASGVLLVVADVRLDGGLRLDGGRAPGNAGWLGAVAAQPVPPVWGG